MTTWRQRISDLRETGLTLSEIGQLTGLSTSAVSDIANGHSESPRGDAAVLLHELHRSKCKVDRVRRA